MPETPMPTLPNFLIAGAAKCGTTSLYYYLRQHPDVYMSEVKEPNFLYRGIGETKPDASFAHGERSSTHSFDAYCRLFDKGAGHKVVGEASTTTAFYYDRAIMAIRRYLGDPRILIILRDPVERAYSNYNYLLRDMRETLTFEDALRAEEMRTKRGYGLMWRYRAVGLYARQVQAFQENFSRVKVVLYDDLKRSPAMLVKEVYRFLEVESGFSPDVSRAYNITSVPIHAGFNALFVKPVRLHRIMRNIGSRLLGENRWIQLREQVRRWNLERPEPMPIDTERELRQFFKADILKLQDRIQRDLSLWLKKEIR
jgi:hypothetical protein